MISLPMAINDLAHPIPPKFSMSIPPSEGPIFFLHFGSSMNPTIFEGDILEVQPYNDDHPRPGDIIVFSSAGNYVDAFIAHRAISVDKGGIITRGDNNIASDPSRLSCESIVGKVIAVWHQGSRRNMAREKIGWTLGESICWNAKIRPRIEPIAYYFMKNNNYIFRLFACFINPRTRIFKSEKGKDMILLLGTRVVGRYSHQLQRWCISRPYCILIDKNSIPTPDDDAERLSNDNMALNLARNSI